MTLSANINFDLVSNMELEQIFQKHIVDGSSYFFREFVKEPNLEYELRHDISSELSISLNDVIIVGSAKIGFSVKNHNFSKFDSKYEKNPINKNKSDLDIAIINRRLFDKEVEEIYEMSRHFSKEWIEEKWKTNIFYNSENDLRRKGLDALFLCYTQYVARGWLRPDFCPDTYLNRLPWKNQVDQWGNRFKRKLSIGLYSDWYYLKHYQMDNLANLRIKIKGLELEHE
jgi:hypothetical protein